jgi:hypothetical protein
MVVGVPGRFRGRVSPRLRGWPSGTPGTSATWFRRASCAPGGPGYQPEARRPDEAVGVAVG